MEHLPRQEKPKRPLSAFNLYYRFKRLAMLEAINTGGNNSGANETIHIHQLINSMPGLEGCSSSDIVLVNTLSEDQVKEIRRTRIRSALQHNICAKNETSKRSHRKSHGAMSFIEMNKIMGDGWKRTDKFAKEVFDELASEGRKIYQARLAEYKKNSPQSHKGANVASKKLMHLSPTIKPRPSKSPKYGVFPLATPTTPTTSTDSMEMDPLSVCHGSFNTEASIYGIDMRSISSERGAALSIDLASVDTRGPKKLDIKPTNKMAGDPIVVSPEFKPLSYGRYMRIVSDSSIATQPPIELPCPSVFVQVASHETVQVKMQPPHTEVCCPTVHRPPTGARQSVPAIATLEKSDNSTMSKPVVVIKSKITNSLLPLPFTERKGSNRLGDQLFPSSEDYMELLSNLFE